MGAKNRQVENANPNWWVYKQTAYWLDGLTRCAILLENEEYLAKATKIIQNFFANADEDGYLCPKFLKENNPWNRWPHVVFFRACMALYEYNHDQTIIKKIEKHYLGNVVSYTVGRDLYNIEIVLWLYEKMGNEQLLQMAIDAYKGYNERLLVDQACFSDLKSYNANKKDKDELVS